MFSSSGSLTTEDFCGDFGTGSSVGVSIMREWKDFS